jgi:hypothetical protein
VTVVDHLELDRAVEVDPLGRGFDVPRRGAIGLVVPAGRRLAVERGEAAAGEPRRAVRTRPIGIPDVDVDPFVAP